MKQIQIRKRDSKSSKWSEWQDLNFEDSRVWADTYTKAHVVKATYTLHDGKQEQYRTTKTLHHRVTQTSWPSWGVLVDGEPYELAPEHCHLSYASIARVKDLDGDIRLVYYWLGVENVPDPTEADIAEIFIPAHISVIYNSFITQLGG